MTQFWQRWVMIIGISLGCAHVAESASQEGTSEKDVKFKEWYKIADVTMKTCNFHSCRSRRDCLTAIHDKLLPAGKQQALKEEDSDWNLILAKTVELEKREIFYGVLLHMSSNKGDDGMSPYAWKTYKGGKRIKDTYLTDLAAFQPWERAGMPVDVDENAVFMLLMQRSIPEDKEESGGYNYEKIVDNINQLIEELRSLTLPSTQKLIKKLEQLNKDILKLVFQKDQHCPPEILQAIREQLSPTAQQQLDQELSPLLSLKNSSLLANKQRFDNEWKNASQQKREINPASEGDYQAERNELLKRLYQAAVSSHKQCSLNAQGQPTCFLRMQAAFLDIKKSMDPRDPRQAMVDFYLKSTQELINAVVYRGELFVWDKYPDVRERYKTGPRIKASEYFKSLKAWATALNIPVDPKKPDKKPKANFVIDRMDILVLLSQQLIRAGEGCQDRKGWETAAQGAFQLVKSHLYNNLLVNEDKESIAGELDSLLKEMRADAPKEWPLIIAKAIWRDLPLAEQAKLPEPPVKDKDHFDREMLSAAKNVEYINPVPNLPSDKGDEEAEGSEFEKQLGKATKDFAGKMLSEVFKKVTGAIAQKGS